MSVKQNQRRRDFGTGSISRRGFLTQTAALSAAALAAGTFRVPKARAKDLTHVRMIWDYSPNTMDIFYVAAEEQGFFREEGIEIEHILPQDFESATIMTGAGKAEFGVTYGQILPSAVALEDMPLISVAEIQPFLPLGVQTPDQSCQDPSCFKGKKCGILNVDLERECFKRMLQAVGLTVNDVDLVDPGMAIVQPLVTGDLYAATATPMFEQEQVKRLSGGIVTKLFFYADYGSPRFNFCMIANRDYAEKNPEITKGWVKAMHRGLQWSLDNKKEAVQMWTKRFPEFEFDIEMLTWSIMEMTWVIPGVTKEKGLGWNTGDNWQAWADLMYEAKLIPEKLDATRFWTNDYLPKDKYLPRDVDAYLAAQAKVRAS
ncbi:MAG: ABC transporter substrate-binding protein [Deltaproteobacteria bacterium]|nr:ABC transporter substrate-binding protein [Deltaproteobacteria bacterium]